MGRIGTDGDCDGHADDGGSLGFSTLCELQATFEQASRDKATMGSALKTERDTAAALRPYFEMFGFTAQSRKRLHITWPPVAATVNPLDKFLNRRRSKWDGLLP